MLTALALGRHKLDSTSILYEAIRAMAISQQRFVSILAYEEGISSQKVQIMSQRIHQIMGEISQWFATLSSRSLYFTPNPTYGYAGYGVSGPGPVWTQLLPEDADYYDTHSGNNDWNVTPITWHELFVDCHDTAPTSAIEVLLEDDVSPNIGWHVFLFVDGDIAAYKDASNAWGNGVNKRYSFATYLKSLTVPNYRTETSLVGGNKEIAAVTLITNAPTDNPIEALLLGGVQIYFNQTTGYLGKAVEALRRGPSYMYPVWNPELPVPAIVEPITLEFFDWNHLKFQIAYAMGQAIGLTDPGASQPDNLMRGKLCTKPWLVESVRYPQAFPPLGGDDDIEFTGATLTAGQITAIQASSFGQVYP